MKATRKQFLASSAALMGSALLQPVLATPALADEAKNEESAKEFKITRLSGDTRHDTMVAINDELIKIKKDDDLDVDASDVVIIASGNDFPDALAASALAGAASAPIVLTESDSLTPQARKQLRSYEPALVIIVGGKKAISEDVEAAIEGNIGRMASVKRLYGETRFETALAILNQRLVLDDDKTSAPWSDTVIIANGNNYPDALSISSFAAATKSPIVLSDPAEGLSVDALEAIKEHEFANAIIVGGKSAVPADVENQLASIKITNVERLAGETRYETSVEIADYLINEGYAKEADGEEGGKGYLNFFTPIFATGENFPDALVAGTLGGWTGSPIILVNDNAKVAIDFVYNQQTAKTIDESKRATGAYIVGGHQVVSDALESKLKDALSGKSADDK